MLNMYKFNINSASMTKESILSAPTPSATDPGLNQWEARILARPLCWSYHGNAKPKKSQNLKAKASKILADRSQNKNRYINGKQDNLSGMAEDFKRSDLKWWNSWFSITQVKEIKVKNTSPSHTHTSSDLFLQLGWIFIVSNPVIFYRHGNRPQPS